MHRSRVINSISTVWSNFCNIFVTNLRVKNDNFNENDFVEKNSKKMLNYLTINQQLPQVV